MTVTRWAACAAGVFLVGACSSDGGTNPPPPPPPLSFAVHIQPTFTASCATGGCHVGVTPAADLNLSQGQAHAEIVNVASSQVPHLMLIEPNDPDSSYLMIKLLGDAGLIAGVPSQMPLSGPALRAGQLDTIGLWIDNGAPNN